MARKKKTVTVQLSKRKKTTQKTKQQEIGRLGMALRALGGLGGGALGGLVGMSGGGSAAGTSLGASLSRWLGSGDYSVGQNTIVNSMKASGSIPMMHSNDQTVVVRHKEFLMEIQGNTTFTVNRSLTINPGNKITFPWLSRIANSYQQYRIKGMVYHYVPTSGDANTTALGTVMMQTSYRSSDSPPLSKTELLNEYWSTESSPTNAFAHPIECNPAENPFNIQYVRGTNQVLPAGDSPLLYDLGTTHVCTSGQAASGVSLGDLWVTYEIELKKPIIQSNVTGGTFIYADYLFSTTVSLANPFGTVTNFVGNQPLTFGTSRQVVIPAAVEGYFWFVLAYKTTGTFNSASSTGAPAVTNAVVINWSPYQDRYEAYVGATSVFIYACRILKAGRESAATVTFPLASTTGSTVAAVELTMFGTTDAV